MQRPFFSQSPYRVGSGPLGPPISFKLVFLASDCELVLSSLRLFLSGLLVLSILFIISIRCINNVFSNAALQGGDSKVI